MTEEEQAVLAFLGADPEAFFARKEIARRAVRRQVFDENPHWLDPALVSLTNQDFIEKNDSGHYRCRQSRSSD